MQPVVAADIDDDGIVNHRHDHRVLSLSALPGLQGFGLEIVEQVPISGG